VEGVFPLTDPVTNETSYIWHSTAVPGGPRIAWGGHIFHPLQFNGDGSVKPLECSPAASFKVQATPGKGDKPTGKAISATDGSPAIANVSRNTNLQRICAYAAFIQYQPVCDSDVFTLYQTWTSAKSGTLKDISVNIAKAYQRMPLNIGVFKFSSYEELVRPKLVYPNN
jgi:hypothetical protein